MIPIIFERGTTEFRNNGLGALVDCISCTVTEERNGAYEMLMEYPADGKKHQEIKLGRIILAKPNDVSRTQPFLIYSVSCTIKGILTVKAEHISYAMNSLIALRLESESAKDAIDQLKGKVVSSEAPYRFNFLTDVGTTGHFNSEMAMPLRTLVGGNKKSILSAYGGELEFDRFDVRLRQNRGYDSGVTIAYGKNMTGIKYEERSDGIVTGVFAHWIGKEPESAFNEVLSLRQPIFPMEYPFFRDVLINVSSDFETRPTQEQVDAKALDYFNRQQHYPYFTVSVEFVNLGDTEEYKQYKYLERIALCDIVTVRHSVYGLDFKLKAIKTVYDSIREKYNQIVLGEAWPSIVDTLVKI